MSVYLDIKSLYPHLKVNWNVLLCKICIAWRLVVDIFPWCNAHYVPFPSGTLVACRMGNGSITGGPTWHSIDLLSHELVKLVIIILLSENVQNYCNVVTMISVACRTLLEMFCVVKQHFAAFSQLFKSTWFGRCWIEFFIFQWKSAFQLRIAILEY